MNNHYFSVIIPLYNKELFVERCIQSVLNQTYPNYEIIIVNDGSTDNSLEKVRSMTDPHIKVFSKPNGGVSSARNEGVVKASYDYVVFLDADDTWEVGFLTELNSLVNEFPQAGIYGINHVYHYSNRPAYFDSYKELFGNDRQCGILEDYFGLFATLGRSPFSNSGCCYPKKVFIEIGGYKKGIKLTEDSDLWCRIALRYPVVFSNLPLATYFVEASNNTRSIIEYQEFQVTNTLRRFLTSEELTSTRRKSISKLLAFQQLSLVRRAILNNEYLFAFKMLFKKELIQYYPLKFLYYPILLVLPSNFVVWVNRLVKSIKNK